MLGLTGLAVKFSDMLVSLGRENMVATLILAMVVLIILGMGIPPTAVYVLGGSIVVPALIGLGLKPLPAHLFTFYFACLGAITPPVCAAVFVNVVSRRVQLVEDRVAGNSAWAGGVDRPIYVRL